VYSVAARGTCDRAFTHLEAQPWVDAIDTHEPGRWEVTVADRAEAEHSLLRLLVRDHAVQVTDFRPVRRSLEDIYLELVGGNDGD